MREVIFRKQNKRKWEKIEKIFSQPKESNADQIANGYIEIMSDLSYAKTYYPNSRTFEYLNNFATQIHNEIYVNKVENRGSILKFWKYELPLTIRKHHKLFLFGFLFFLFFVLLGVAAQMMDSDYARVIIGDGYVNMTLDNIKKDDPMAVYKRLPPFAMFIYILFNNFLVMLRTAASGVLPVLGPLYFIGFNGLMVGSFLTFFIQQGLFWESFRTIFIHGTIELIAISISGTASLVISFSILFPGTYSRFQSFLRGIKDAAKIAIGLVPFIILAAFIEGYVTRYTQMPDWLSISIIGLSLVLMVFYYVIYPLQINERYKQQQSPILEVTDLQ